MQNKINNINEDMNGIKNEVSTANEKLYGIEIKIDSLECEDKSMKEIQIEQNNILGSLLHNSEINKATHDNIEHNIAYIKGDTNSIKEDIAEIRRDLNLVELATSKNWSDIVRLKSVK